MSAHPPARQALEALDSATLSLLVLSLRHERSDEALGELLLLEPGVVAQSKQAARPPAPRVRHPAAADRAKAAQRAAVARFARLGHPLYCGARRGRYIALTFDDGPGPYTPLALRKLRAAHVPATFFIVGRNIHSFPGT